jgi:hypothetical protein
MGRWYGDKKGVVEDYLQISIADLRKWGYLNSYKHGSLVWTRNDTGNESRISVTTNLLTTAMYMQLSYAMTNNFTGEKETFDYKIPITTTTPNYGGERFWFVCPLYKDGVQCGRRVAKLYGGRWFGCRHCHDLSYATRNVPATFRGYPFNVIAMSDKVEKLQQRMKYRYYAGKPTKLYQRICELQP